MDVKVLKRIKPSDEINLLNENRAAHSTVRRNTFYLCAGLIPAQGKPVILKAEFTFTLLRHKRFVKLSSDGLFSSSLLLLKQYLYFCAESLVTGHFFLHPCVSHCQQAQITHRNKIVTTVIKITTHIQS